MTTRNTYNKILVKNSNLELNHFHISIGLKRNIWVLVDSSLRAY